MIFWPILALALVQNSPIEWQQAFSLSCAQFKVHGKGKGSVPFSLFKAAQSKQGCCNAEAVVFRGKTQRFGYFTVPIKLEVAGNYYLVFDYKESKLTIPIEMRNNAQSKECDERDHIINFDRSGRPELSVFIVVD